MVDVIQKNMERMVPDLEELQTSGLCSKEEVSKIVKKRREHEYAMHRTGKELIDFLRAIEYELNLSYLIKHRNSRLKIPSKTAYSSILSRVHGLFHSAAKVYKGDVRLWLQYIDFAYRRGFGGQALSKIFADAISLHPHFIPFWITASSWEYFSNDNILAARILLQRANRLNPKNEQILVEYCRLELAYRQKIKARMTLFGVDEATVKNQNNNNSTGLTDAVPGAENKPGQLEEATNKLSKESKNNNSKSSNPFLEGAIPIAVYKTAIKMFPQNFHLRKQFAQVISSFYDTQHILDIVYEGIEEDFPGDALAQAFVARRPFDSPPAPEPIMSETTNNDENQEDEENKMNVDQPRTVEIDLFDVTNQVVSNFEAALSRRSSPELYEQYTAFMLEILERVDNQFTLNAADTKANDTPQNEEESNQVETKPEANPALTTFLRKKLVLVFKEAFANGFISEIMSLRWVDVLLAFDRLDDALDAADKCAKALPSNPLVNATFFSLVGQLMDTVSKESASAKQKKYYMSYDQMDSALTQALRQANLEHPSAGDLFTLYWKFLFSHESKKHSPDEKDEITEDSLIMKQAMSQYKRTIVKLKGRSLERFKIQSLSTTIARWHEHSEESIGLVRSLYQIGLETPPTSFEYYKMCINYETKIGTKDALSRSRRMFEACVADFGQHEKDVWLTYIAWETALGDHTKAAEVYHRAKRTLLIPDEFIAEYSAILNQKDETEVANDGVSVEEE